MCRFPHFFNINFLIVLTTEPFPHDMLTSAGYSAGAGFGFSIRYMLLLSDASFDLHFFHWFSQKHRSRYLGSMSPVDRWFGPSFGHIQIQSLNSFQIPFILEGYKIFNSGLRWEKWQIVPDQCEELIIVAIPEETFHFQQFSPQVKSSLDFLVFIHFVSPYNLEDFSCRQSDMLSLHHLRLVDSRSD